jgi:hypothetical protein
VRVHLAEWCPENLATLTRYVAQSCNRRERERERETERAKRQVTDDPPVVNFKADATFSLAPALPARLEKLDWIRRMSH